MSESSPHFKREEILRQCSICTSNIIGACIKCLECRRRLTTLCIPCFQLGAEAGEHVRGHNYEVIDPIGPAICPTGSDGLTWSLSDDLLLYDFVREYKLGNWEELVKLFPDKRKALSARSHFDQCFLNGPIWNHVKTTDEPHFKEPSEYDAAFSFDPSEVAVREIGHNYIRESRFETEKTGNIDAFGAHAACCPIPIGRCVIKLSEELKPTRKRGKPRKTRSESEEEESAGVVEDDKLTELRKLFPESLHLMKQRRAYHAAAGRVKDDDLNALGYMPHRDDFEVEHRNRSELLICGNNLFERAVCDPGRQFENEVKMIRMQRYRRDQKDREVAKGTAREFGLVSQFVSTLKTSNEPTPRTDHEELLQKLSCMLDQGLMEGMRKSVGTVIKQIERVERLQDMQRRGITVFKVSPPNEKSVIRVNQFSDLVLVADILTASTSGGRVFVTFDGGRNVEDVEDVEEEFEEAASTSYTTVQSGDLLVRTARHPVSVAVRYRRLRLLKGGSDAFCVEFGGSQPPWRQAGRVADHPAPSSSSGSTGQPRPSRYAANRSNGSTSASTQVVARRTVTTATSSQHQSNGSTGRFRSPNGSSIRSPIAQSQQPVSKSQPQPQSVSKTQLSQPNKPNNSEKDDKKQPKRKNSQEQPKAPTSNAKQPEVKQLIPDNPFFSQALMASIKPRIPKAVKKVVQNIAKKPAELLKGKQTAKPSTLSAAQKKKLREEAEQKKRQEIDDLFNSPSTSNSNPASTPSTRKPRVKARNASAERPQEIPKRRNSATGPPKLNSVEKRKDSPRTIHHLETRREKSDKPKVKKKEENGVEEPPKKAREEKLRTERENSVSATSSKRNSRDSVFSFSPNLHFSTPEFDLSPNDLSTIEELQRIENSVETVNWNDECSSRASSSSTIPPELQNGDIPDDLFDLYRDCDEDDDVTIITPSSTPLRTRSKTASVSGASVRSSATLRSPESIRTPVFSPLRPSEEPEKESPEAEPTVFPDIPMATCPESPDSPGSSDSSESSDSESSESSESQAVSVIPEKVDETMMFSPVLSISDESLLLSEDSGDSSEDSESENGKPGLVGALAPRESETPVEDELNRLFASEVVFESISSPEHESERTVHAVIPSPRPSSESSTMSPESIRSPYLSPVRTPKRSEPQESGLAVEESPAVVSPIAVEPHTVSEPVEETLKEYSEPSVSVQTIAEPAKSPELIAEVGVSSPHASPVSPRSPLSSPVRTSEVACVQECTTRLSSPSKSPEEIFENSFPSCIPSGEESKNAHEVEAGEYSMDLDIDVADIPLPATPETTADVPYESVALETVNEPKSPEESIEEGIAECAPLKDPENSPEVRMEEPMDVADIPLPTEPCSESQESLPSLKTPKWSAESFEESFARNNPICVGPVSVADIPLPEMFHGFQDSIPSPFRSPARTPEDKREELEAGPEAIDSLEVPSESLTTCEATPEEHFEPSIAAYPEASKSPQELLEECSACNIPTCDEPEYSAEEKEDDSVNAAIISPPAESSAEYPESIPSPFRSPARTPEEELKAGPEAIDSPEEPECGMPCTSPREFDHVSELHETCLEPSAGPEATDPVSDAESLVECEATPEEHLEEPSVEVLTCEEPGKAPGISEESRHEGDVVILEDSNEESSPTMSSPQMNHIEDSISPAMEASEKSPEGTTPLPSQMNCLDDPGLHMSPVTTVGSPESSRSLLSSPVQACEGVETIPTTAPPRRSRSPKKIQGFALVDYDLSDSELEMSPEPMIAEAESPLKSPKMVSEDGAPEPQKSPFEKAEDVQLEDLEDAVRSAEDRASQLPSPFLSPGRTPEDPEPLTVGLEASDSSEEPETLNRAADVTEFCETPSASAPEFDQMSEEGAELQQETCSEPSVDVEPVEKAVEFPESKDEEPVQTEDVLCPHASPATTVEDPEVKRVSPKPSEDIPCEYTVLETRRPTRSPELTLEESVPDGVSLQEPEKAPEVIVEDSMDMDLDVADIPLPPSPETTVDKPEVSRSSAEPSDDADGIACESAGLEIAVASKSPQEVLEECSACNIPTCDELKDSPEEKENSVAAAVITPPTESSAEYQESIHSLFCSPARTPEEPEPLQMGPEATVSSEMQPASDSESFAPCEATSGEHLEPSSEKPEISPEEKEDSVIEADIPHQATFQESIPSPFRSPARTPEDEPEELKAGPEATVFSEVPSDSLTTCEATPEEHFQPSTSTCEVRGKSPEIILEEPTETALELAELPSSGSPQSPKATPAAMETGEEQSEPSIGVQTIEEPEKSPELATEELAPPPSQVAIEITESVAFARLMPNRMIEVTLAEMSIAGPIEFTAKWEPPSPPAPVKSTEDALDVELPTSKAVLEDLLTRIDDELKTDDSTDVEDAPESLAEPQNPPSAPAEIVLDEDSLKSPGQSVLNDSMVSEDLSLTKEFPELRDSSVLGTPNFSESFMDAVLQESILESGPTKEPQLLRMDEIPESPATGPFSIKSLLSQSKETITVAENPVPKPMTSVQDSLLGPSIRVLAEAGKEKVGPGAVVQKYEKKASESETVDENLPDDWIYDDEQPFPESPISNPKALGLLVPLGTVESEKEKTSTFSSLRPMLTADVENKIVSCVRVLPSKAVDFRKEPLTLALMGIPKKRQADSLVSDKLQNHVDSEKPQDLPTKIREIEKPGTSILALQKPTESSLLDLPSKNQETLLSHGTPTEFAVLDLSTKSSQIPKLQLESKASDDEMEPSVEEPEEETPAEPEEAESDEEDASSTRLQIREKTPDAPPMSPEGDSELQDKSEELLHSASVPNFIHTLSAEWTTPKVARSVDDILAEIGRCVERAEGRNSHCLVPYYGGGVVATQGQGMTAPTIQQHVFVQNQINITQKIVVYKDREGIRHQEETTSTFEVHTNQVRQTQIPSSEVAKGMLPEGLDMENLGLLTSATDVLPILNEEAEKEVASKPEEENRLVPCKTVPEMPEDIMEPPESDDEATGMLLPAIPELPNVPQTLTRTDTKMSHFTATTTKKGKRADMMNLGAPVELLDLIQGKFNLDKLEGLNLNSLFETPMPEPVVPEPQETEDTVFDVMSLRPEPPFLDYPEPPPTKERKLQLTVPRKVLPEPALPVIPPWFQLPMLTYGGESIDDLTAMFDEDLCGILEPGDMYGSSFYDLNFQGPEPYLTTLCKVLFTQLVERVTEEAIFKMYIDDGIPLEVPIPTKDAHLMYGHLLDSYGRPIVEEIMAIKDDEEKSGWDFVIRIADKWRGYVQMEETWQCVLEETPIYRNQIEELLGELVMNIIRRKLEKKWARSVLRRTVKLRRIIIHWCQEIVQMKYELVSLKGSRSVPDAERSKFRRDHILLDFEMYSVKFGHKELKKMNKRATENGLRRNLVAAVAYEEFSHTIFGCVFAPIQAIKDVDVSTKLVKRMSVRAKSAVDSTIAVENRFATDILKYMQDHQKFELQKTRVKTMVMPAKKLLKLREAARRAVRRAKLPRLRKDEEFLKEKRKCDLRASWDIEKSRRHITNDPQICKSAFERAVSRRICLAHRRRAWEKILVDWVQDRYWIMIGRIIDNLDELKDEGGLNSMTWILFKKLSDKVIYDLLANVYVSECAEKAFREAMEWKFEQMLQEAREAKKYRGVVKYVNQLVDEQIQRLAVNAITEESTIASTKEALEYEIVYSLWDDLYERHRCAELFYRDAIDGIMKEMCVNAIWERADARRVRDEEAGRLVIDGVKMPERYACNERFRRMNHPMVLCNYGEMDPSLIIPVDRIAHWELAMSCMAKAISPMVTDLVAVQVQRHNEIAREIEEIEEEDVKDAMAVILTDLFESILRDLVARVWDSAIVEHVKARRKKQMIERFRFIAAVEVENANKEREEAVRDLVQHLFNAFMDSWFEDRTRELARNVYMEELDTINPVEDLTSAMMAACAVDTSQVTSTHRIISHTTRGRVGAFIKEHTDLAAIQDLEYRLANAPRLSRIWARLHALFYRSRVQNDLVPTGFDLVIQKGIAMISKAINKDYCYQILQLQCMPRMVENAALLMLAKLVERCKEDESFDNISAMFKREEVDSLWKVSWDEAILNTGEYDRFLDSIAVMRRGPLAVLDEREEFAVKDPEANKTNMEEESEEANEKRLSEVTVPPKKPISNGIASSAGRSASSRLKRGIRNKTVSAELTLAGRENGELLDWGDAGRAVKVGDFHVDLMGSMDSGIDIPFVRPRRITEKEEAPKTVIYKVPHKIPTEIASDSSDENVEVVAEKIVARPKRIPPTRTLGASEKLHRSQRKRYRLSESPESEGERRLRLKAFRQARSGAALTAGGGNEVPPSPSPEF